MSSWPSIDEPELLERLAMDDDEFEAFIRSLASNIPPREYGAATYALALDYPWARPEGSFWLADGVARTRDDLGAREWERLVDEATGAGSSRSPLLAIGANAAPEGLERKLAHFPDPEDRALLALTGRLHDFDVGVAAQVAIYGAMPATLFPSPGTAVCATVLWVTPTQFTQLTWSELSYWLGKLQTRFEFDGGGPHSAEVLAFVSRFGAFCVDGDPVALAAIPASGRTATALTQEQLLDAAAALALGPGTTAETIVRAIFTDMGEVGPKIAATVWKAALPFASERWTPFTPRSPR